jgi:hypothetical protein
MDLLGELFAPQDALGVVDFVRRDAWGRQCTAKTRCIIADWQLLRKWFLADYAHSSRIIDAIARPHVIS